MIEDDFFNWPSPISVPKRKTANQPTTADVAKNPVTKKGRDWLLCDFLFGTEIGEGQLKLEQIAIERSASKP